MKKILFFLFACLFMLAVPVMAQSGSETQPGNLVVQYFTSLSALAGAVLIVTQFVLKFVKTKFDQYLSWLVAIVLSAAGWLLHLGIFSGLEWYWILIYGFSSGLVANGLFDVNIINAILNYLLPKAKNKK